MLVLDCAEEDVPSVKELFERNGRFSGISSVLPIREGRRGRGRGRGGGGGIKLPSSSNRGKRLYDLHTETTLDIQATFSNLWSQRLTFDAISMMREASGGGGGSGFFASEMTRDAIRVTNPTSNLGGGSRERLDSGHVSSDCHRNSGPL